MPDNIDITAGTGTTVATDDVGGIHYQRIKLAYGADDAATMVQNTAPVPIKFGSPTTSDYTEASISAASSGENTLVSGTASQTIRVFAIFLVVASAVDIKFKDAAGGTDLTGAMTMKTGGSFVLDPTGHPWFTTATAGAFILNLSAAVQTSGRIYYTKS